MANISTCAKLSDGLDDPCDSAARKYYQQAMVINKDDILSYEITAPAPNDEHLNYNVSFVLKADTQAFMFRGPEAGNSYYGSADKSRNDLGFPQYLHMVQVLIAGIKEKPKSVLDTLDKGSYVVVLQLLDGTIEVFGIQYGLTTQDYSFNIVEGGGGVPVILGSLETSPEKTLPLIYKAQEGGDASADFDSFFVADPGGLF